MLSRLKERGVELNWEKCEFRVTELDFLGHRITEEGISPSTAKVNAVLSFRSPSSESEVRSFLGLANYMNKFIPDLATLAEPLRELTKKDVKFEWSSKHNDVFEKIKTNLAAAVKLGFFDVTDKTMVMADASPTGLGAVLLQSSSEGDMRIISFASKSLTDTERRYCQTEREALALVWSVERFSTYLYGRPFDLMTDCKALQYLFTPRSRPCARIERWVLRLQSFDYQVMHIPGPQNIADCLSRLSTVSAKAFDLNEELVIREIAVMSGSAVALKWKEIKEESEKDKEISEVRRILKHENEENLPLAFKVIVNELSTIDTVLLRMDRIVIPTSLRDRVLRIGHEGHPGMRMMKSHLRTNVWWPKMDSDIEKYVKQCRGCTLVSAPNPPEPMIRRELPTQPWMDIAADFLGPLPEGQYLLVVVDYYSRFIEVCEMTDITASQTIKELATIFSRYGLPTSLRVDNGPQFSERCDEFREFCDVSGIALINTIPFWPAMNGEVERQNRSLLKRLRIAQELGKDWRMELRNYLLTYHSTSHSTTGKSPAELMFGRKIRSKLPVIPPVALDDEDIRDRDKTAKEKGKIYGDHKRKAKDSGIEVGDRVLVKRMKKSNKLDADFSPEEFEVIRKVGGDTTVRSCQSGKEYRRIVTHLKKVISPEPMVVVRDSEKGDRRTKRVTSEPVRFQDYIPH